MRQPADLLTALLDACRRGLVTHCEAAKLIGIRKEDFGDLVAWRMAEAAGWRVYESAFHRTFPECNARLFRPQDRGFKDDNLRRGTGLLSECRHYTADEAMSLPRAHPHCLMREPEKADEWENRCSEMSLPSTLTRVLPRVVIGQQLQFD